MKHRKEASDVLRSKKQSTVRLSCSVCKAFLMYFKLHLPTTVPRMYRSVWFVQILNKVQVMEIIC